MSVKISLPPEDRGLQTQELPTTSTAYVQVVLHYEDTPSTLTADRSVILQCPNGVCANLNFTRLRSGRYSLTATAYDGPDPATATKIAVNINKNLFKLIGGVTRAAAINLVRVYPLGTGATNPWGLTVDSAGNVWTSNRNSNNVTKLNASGVVQFTANPASTITGAPEGIAADSAGNVWVAQPSPTPGKVVKISADGTTALATIVDATTCGNPTWTATNTANDDVYVACKGSGNERRYNSAGTFQNNRAFAGIVTVAYTAAASGLTWSLDNTGPDRVQRTNSTLASQVVAALGGGSTSSYGVDADTSGNGWAVDTAGNGIYKINATGGTLTPVGPYSVANTPFLIAMDNDAGGSNAWVTRQATNLVSRLTNAGTLVNTYIIGSSSAPSPQGIDFDANAARDWLWVANGADNNLSRILRTLSISSCPASVARGSSVSISGGGFDTAGNAFNTVLIGDTAGVGGRGYVATVTSVAAGSITVTLPSTSEAPATTGPITITNKNGIVVSNCDFSMT